ncbi:hypothetical protein HRD49_35150 [Corallococcus exiguus]|uniref:hypothetical protein n=1 Tax=Corallococcus TaxID=83461 RepID=UPI000EA360A8|nr:MULTISPECIES: hypothetical protein [unclassified Corallococcus]NNC18838.1 hypothetical protein [Corallococcus exiguus]NRD57279.1 hypothetical protein [Corallococcus exiguus]NRD66998.1 hypothetical protein [Corallococcus exiguus]RKH28271.1 hypothetical protein D7V77_09250 [Corallococcus sp. CA041A]RKI01052.1 hypothetical protein D7Y15_36710 [Corallococcus sp. AB030]
MRSLSKSAALALVLAATGCSDPVDKAAKARIFSAEDPPKVVASAKEKLPPEDVADNPQVSRRILGMDAAEVTERLGPHFFQSTLSYEWAGPNGNNPVKLTETRSFRAGPGGVNGDFHGVLENSRDQGLEVMRVKGQVFARNRYGPYRQRLRDRGMAERTRTELTGAIRDFDSLFQGRIKLTPAGTVTHEGRTAWKYNVSLGSPLEGGTPKKMPAAFTPKNADETTKRRANFFSHRLPRSLEGEVLVDSVTSVVLKARLDGRIGVPQEKTPEAAELRMTLESSLTEIGKDPALQPPQDFLPDADKPQGIADAMDHFGIPRTKAGDSPATPGAAAGAPEPEDEAEGN